MIVGFLKGISEAASGITDPTTAEVAASRLAVDSGLREDEIKSRLSGVTTDMSLDRGALEVVLDLRVRYGLTPPMGPDLSAYVDAAYAEEAR